MNKKILYAVLPLLGLGILGAGAASAQGFFGGGLGLMAANPEVAENMVSMHENMFKNQADILGLSVDEIKNAWAEGKSLKELVAEKGISEEQLKAKIQETRTAQMKTQLQALVNKGIITQAQADKRLETIRNAWTNGRGFGKMKFHHGWF